MAREEGDTAAATDAFQRAGDLLARGGDGAGLGYVLRSLGQLALRQGDNASATHYFERGRDLHVTMGDRRGESAALVDIANLVDLEGRPVDALALRSRALELARTTGSREAMASALLACAAGLSDLGRLAQSHIAAEDALTLYTAVDIPRGVAASLVTRAAIRRILGRLVEGEADLDRAAQLLDGDDTFCPDLAALAAGRAGARELRGQIGDARALLAKARNFYGSADVFSGVHRTHLIEVQLDAYKNPRNILALALEDDRLTAARDFFDKTEDAPGQWTVRQVAATLHRCHGDLAGAAAQFNELAVTASAQGRTLDAATARHSAAEARVRLGEPPDPAALDEIVNAASHAPFLRIRVKCLQCEAAAARGDFETATIHLKAAQADIEEATDGYRAGTTLALDAASRLAHAQGEVDRATNLGDEAIGLYEAAEDHLGADELRAALS
jgi:tetratricopeptide (TPR) repeat protein